MARPRKQRSLDSYTIKAIKETIRTGDTVMMRPSEKGGKSYVARIEKMERVKNQVILHVRWYYRPEESIGGRRQFHGSNEVFFSEHTDVQPVDCIEGKCTVHSFKAYTKLESVGREDFFCRFNYNYLTGAFTPDRVAVYCKCEMPYNPDDLMVQCEGCSDWYHPTCIGMTEHEAKSVEHFYCEICSRENLQKPQHSKTSDMKGDSKRRRL